MTFVGIKLNLSKSKVGQKEVKFWGHVISKDGYKPDSTNIDAIVRMKPPTNVKEVRRFLGMVGFYRKHIEGFAKTEKPITNLAKRDKHFIWSDECQKAFQLL